VIVKKFHQSKLPQLAVVADDSLQVIGSLDVFKVLAAFATGEVDARKTLS